MLKGPFIRKKKLLESESEVKRKAIKRNNIFWHAFDHDENFTNCFKRFPSIVWIP